MVRESDVWKLLLRYQAQSERFYSRAIEEFERLKASHGDYRTNPFRRANPNHPNHLSHLQTNPPRPWKPHYIKFSTLKRLC